MEQIDDEAIKRIAQAIANGRGFGTKASHCMVDATVAWAEAKTMLAACADLQARCERLEDAGENVCIAFGMGWDMDGVIEVLCAALQHTTAETGDDDR